MEDACDWKYWGLAVVGQFQKFLASRHILHWHTQKRCVENGKELEGEESSSLASIRLAQILNNMDGYAWREDGGFTLLSVGFHYF